MNPCHGWEPMEFFSTFIRLSTTRILPLTNRAAHFCSSCSLLSWLSVIPYKRAFAQSMRDMALACQYLGRRRREVFSYCSQLVELEETSLQHMVYVFDQFPFVSQPTLMESCWNFDTCLRVPKIMDSLSQILSYSIFLQSPMMRHQILHFLGTKMRGIMSQNYEVHRFQELGILNKQMIQNLLKAKQLSQWSDIL